MPKWIRMTAVGALVLFGLAACDSDDGDSDLQAYCELGAQLDEQDGPPTEEQLERMKDIRPDEIGADIDFVADALIEAEGDVGAVFSDPEVGERFANIETFDAENCDNAEGNAGGDEAAAPGAGTEYCELAEELNSADGPPGPEQLEQYKELAPEEISEQATFVADAFIAAGDNIGAAFSDPAVEEQLGQLEAFEAEHCGIDRDEGGAGDDLETEPAEGANVVEIAGVDFGFEGVPSEIPAGATAFAFSNGGECAHEMIVFQLQEGKTADDMLALEGEDDPAAAEVVAGEVGGTFGTPGSETTYVNAEIDPGTYALMCFIPGPEGKSHAELGMRATFTAA